MQSQAGNGPSANGQELKDVPWVSSPLPILPFGKQEIAFFPSGFWDMFTHGYECPHPMDMPDSSYLGPGNK